MEKRRIIVVAASLMMTVLVSASVFAQQEIPGGGWYSGTQIQNVDTDAASITMTLYNKDNDVTCQAQESIDPGEAKTLSGNSFDNCAGFQGSAVVSSNGLVKAIVNVTNREGNNVGISGGLAAGQYQGMDSDQLSDKLFFPLAKGNFFDKTTTFYIQNAGTGNVSPVATFTMRNGDVHTIPMPAIEPNKMRVIAVQDATTFSPADNAGRVGGLVVDAGDGSALLAGAVLEHKTAENPATILQATRGFTASDFDDQVYAPVIKNSRFGRFTGIQVQNVGTAAIDITVDYTGSGGACAGQTFQDAATNVAAGASHTFVQNAGNTDLPANCTASATVKGTGDIVAIVNESFIDPSQSGGTQRATTFSAIPQNGATTKISVPLFKDQRFGKHTGLQIQNVSASTANITAEFKCSGGATFTATSAPQSVAAGAAVLFFRPSAQADKFTGGTPFSAANVNCGVTVTADQQVVAIANESVTAESGLSQDNNNYEGFNVAP